MASSTRLMRRLLPVIALVLSALPATAQQTQRPPLHGKAWVALTGKPLSAAAGAMIFQQGGNAVDAAAAMLAAGATLWDVLSWGGETQAIIYNPKTKQVIGVNALGVAPTGATPQFFKGKGMDYPPEFGPLAATTPGTPGGLMVMLAEFGTLSLAQVLAPAISLADGYPIEAQTANSIESNKRRIKEWKYSPAVFLPHLGEEREAPRAGEMFRQPDLAATLRKLVDAERTALRQGKDRKAAIMAAYDRFYRGDIAAEIVRAVQEEGGLFTREDLADWQVKLETTLAVDYKGITVHKLQQWQQGPALLQALNILEPFDLKGMGYNSARYLHTVYQAMSMAFADRDFYYGDPAFPPATPIKGLLSKEYAKARAATMVHDKNDPTIKPGDPYPFEGGVNPFLAYLQAWPPKREPAPRPAGGDALSHDEAFYAGTTSIQAADSSGWVVSVTPSGGWIPAVIAGRTGVGLSQRMQAFVLDEAEAPYNVVAPGKRPRVTLTPTLAMKDGLPWMAFSVQGGDSQDQNLLQYFLNVVEFGMTPQEAAEGANMNSFQMRSSFGDHAAQPGRMLLQEATPPWVRNELSKMGYRLEFGARTSGPITAIWFDRRHGTMWGAVSNHGEDYGIAW
jgi:gamma-glutamyltranspeptidase / glutathione hydrolase